MAKGFIVTLLTSIVLVRSAGAQLAPTGSIATNGNPAQGEIIVTAQKRAQRPQDIPISLTVIGGGDLRRLQANDVATIAAQVPSVIATTSANLPAFTIRGIGLNEFASNFDSPVAIHVDEVYKSKPYMATIPFYDIQRVEALKGPQGTLFGRNTTGGSVNFYTVEPSNETSGTFNVSGDNHGRFRVDGAANLPLTDNLAGRFSYFVSQGSGGPYYNLYTRDRYGAPERGDTLTISLHQENCFPLGYTGADDQGVGKGRGYNANIPLPAGSGDATYRAAMETVVLPKVEAFAPDLIVVASGLDAGAADPLARMLAHSETFRAMTTSVRDLAHRVCGGRLVIVHEGGYSEACVPFLGLAIIEALCNKRSGVIDPMLDIFTAQQPGAAAQAFQDSVVQGLAQRPDVS